MKIANKVIFLDIDGVLNTAQSVLLQAWDKRTDGYTDKKWCPIACSNLRLILAACPDVDLVVSSVWRRLYNKQELKKIFKKNKLPGGRIKSATPLEKRGEDVARGILIQRWLSDNKNVKEFVIIDDDKDMAHLKKHLYQTDSLNGLTLRTALDIVKKFTGKDVNIWEVTKR